MLSVVTQGDTCASTPNGERTGDTAHMHEIAPNAEANFFGGSGQSRYRRLSMSKSPHTDEARNAETNKGKKETMNTNETVEMTAKYDAVKKDMGLLPVPLAVSIHPIGNKGTVRDGVENNAFQIFVKGEYKGAQVWMPESEWYIKCHMKTSRKIYATFEKAQAAKAEIKSKWGTSKKAKKEKKHSMKVVKDVIINELGEDYWNEIVAKAEAAKKAVAA